ncbi:MAG: response regulator [Acidobacteria bacterium]|nr:MAG: response regulator [Acidobacteriota bacterium]
MSAPVILVLEDFEQARFVIRAVLEGGGYEVVEAATEAEALDLCGEPEQRLDLLISDVVLREACGTEVAVRISALRPRLPILFMSGYPIEDVPNVSLLASNQTAAIQFLQKPFDPERLLGKVRELVPAVRKANA